MGWLFRPSILLIASIVLSLSAVALVLWPGATENKASPQAVANGDQEIVWLYAATNTAGWERFVAAVDKAVRRLQADNPALGLTLDKANAFPLQTTAVPAVAVSGGGQSGRLWFRWYKLTSHLKNEDWVKALLQRRPPPLAIIGGSSSDLAINLAHWLKEEVERQSLGETAPLLCLTAATADDEPSHQPGEPDRPLNSIYPGRTYRFCFTNRQMSEAVTEFIWSQPELRPDGDPVYLAYWKDDPYSQDLASRFLEALRAPVARTAALPVSEEILYSVGTFARPNRWETEAAHDLITKKLHEHPTQKRPLLVMPAGTSQSARRFLRGLVRIAPVEARRFIVATGDAIPFNTIYRDRNVAWHIQDLPFSLVFFCHRDPAEQGSGFRAETSSDGAAEPEKGLSSTGTEDLLLYVDIVDAVLQAGYESGKDSAAGFLPASPSELGHRLTRARWLKASDRVHFTSEGPRLFDEDGNRHSGTGEHIVYLRPIIDGEEVAPKAWIEIWAWTTAAESGQRTWHCERLPEIHYAGYRERDGE